MKTITLKTLRPRNPFVRLALQRKAGTHGRSQGSQRRRARIALRRELRQPPPDSP